MSLNDLANLSAQATLRARVSDRGVRDVIQPGDIKDLMNKVTEAKKAAEANLIVRREETAAMRSQVNTALLIRSNRTIWKCEALAGVNYPKSSSASVISAIADLTRYEDSLGGWGSLEHPCKLR